MKISDLLHKLEKSEIFKNFRKDNETKDAFFCAAFIILNFKQSMFEYSLDFRNDKNIFTFKVPFADTQNSEITMFKEDLLEGRKPLEKVEEEKAKQIRVDIDDLKLFAEKEIKNNKITQQLEEIIAVLQSQEGKLVWNLTCMASAFTIINMIIDAETGKIIKFDKKNLMDFVSVKKPEKN